MTDTQYRLYIGKVQPIPEKIKYSFYNHAKQHILFYTDKVTDGMEVYPVTDDILSMLNEQEQSWLFEAKTKVLSEFYRQKEEQLTELLNDFADRFESELIKEQEKSNE